MTGRICFIIALLAVTLLLSACAGKPRLAGQTDGRNHDVAAEGDLFKF